MIVWRMKDKPQARTPMPQTKCKPERKVPTNDRNKMNEINVLYSVIVKGVVHGRRRKMHNASK